MGKITGFLEFDRKVEEYAPAEERIKHYKEFTKPLKEKELKDQVQGVWIVGFLFATAVARWAI